MDLLKQKLMNKTATLGVIGLGYVGLPLAVEKAKAGYKTIGFDIQNSKVDLVNTGVNYIGDVVNEDLQAIVRSGMLSLLLILHRLLKLIVYVFVYQHLQMNISSQI